MPFTRRRAIGILAGAVPGAAMAQQSSASPADQSVSLDWLGGARSASVAGVSWGVPWPRGAVKAGQSFKLEAVDGRSLPLQSWPLAYWPDGSMKWIGFATTSNASGPLKLAPAASASSPSSRVSVKESDGFIEIDTGKLQCRLPRQGSDLIDSLSIDGRLIARRARLVCSLENRSDPDAIRLEHFTSRISNLTVEQAGPVRATVKIEGVHKAERGSREWLPFVVRFYFYAGIDSVRMVHTIIFDGDDQKDFIRGLGVTLAVPMREQVHNRHVRFGGEDSGLWSEPVQPLTGRRALTIPGSREDVYVNQLAGKRIPNKETFDARGQKLMTDWAVWDSYKLIQPTADGFTIQKRTNPQSCWLDAGAGRRSSGLALVGDVSGGIGIGIKNSWQSFPASLEVEGAATGEASLTAWLWSPDAAAMDLRHYDTKAHDLDSSYEDVQPGFSTPHGVGRTSELMLFASADVPSKQDTVEYARVVQTPPLLVATPQYLHSCGVFGIWSLPDRSTEMHRHVEDQLEQAFAFYQKEVEQRHWYGFWNYGDVMHQHDGPRHAWRYDVGGFAWDNSELGTDMWLWYSFLRTGRADIFKMAEAMTRHTGEVDTYHLGRFAGLGSRHNVRHWGCGAKEARISQAAYRRFHYYLTTDERSGDLMHQVADADYKATEIDPMRLAAPLKEPLKYPGRVRGGPDWLAFAGNWMTEWERTGNTKYRDKIIIGMDSIAAMPYGFLSGPDNLFGYDPATGKLFPLSDDPYGVYNLTTIMGGAEVVFELNELIDHAGWKKAWLQYCRLYGAPKQIVAKDMTTGNEGSDGAYARPDRLAAYAYVHLKNPALARKALSQIVFRFNAPQHLDPPEVLNPIDDIPRLSTNTIAQGCLNAIEILEMCKDA